MIKISKFYGGIFCAAFFVAGTVSAGNTFKIKVTGHGQVNPKPDAVQSRITAEGECAPSKAAAQTAWQDQLAEIKKAINSELADVEFKVDVNYYVGARYQTFYIRPNYRDFFYYDSCRRDGKKVKVSLDVLSDAEGNIVEEKLGKVWKTNASISLTTTTNNTRLLQTALQKLPSVNFESVTPAGTLFRVGLSRGRGTLTTPTLSKELRELSTKEATLLADKSAASLVKTLGKLGFEKVPGSRPTLKREVQAINPGRVLDKNGNTVAQKVGLNFTVLTEASEGVDAVTEVLVEGKKKFTPDFYELNVNLVGNCFTSQKAAQDARDALVAQIDAQVMADYQEKTIIKGADRRDPYAVPKEGRKVSQSLEEIGGKTFTTERCVLPKGVTKALWEGKEDKEFWSFNEYYRVRDTKERLADTVAARFTEAAGGIDKVEANYSEPSPRFLEQKEKGANRVAILETLGAEAINNAVCEALKNDEFAGTTGVIIGCRLTDQSEDENWDPGFQEESAGLAASRAKSFGGANPANELALQAVQVTTTIEVEVFTKSVGK